MQHVFSKIKTNDGSVLLYFPVGKVERTAPTIYLTSKMETKSNHQYTANLGQPKFSRKHLKIADMTDFKDIFCLQTFLLIQRAACTSVKNDTCGQQLLQWCNG